MVRILKKKYFLFLFLKIIITYESVFHLDMHLDRRSCVLAEISGEKCTKTPAQLWKVYECIIRGLPRWLKPEGHEVFNQTRLEVEKRMAGNLKAIYTQLKH